MCVEQLGSFCRVQVRDVRSKGFGSDGKILRFEKYLGSKSHFFFQWVKYELISDLWHQVWGVSGGMEGRS